MKALGSPAKMIIVTRTSTWISRSDTGGLWLCGVLLGSRDSFELLLRENKAFRGTNDSQFYPPLSEVGLSY